MHHGEGFFSVLPNFPDDTLVGAQLHLIAIRANRDFFLLRVKTSREKAPVKRLHGPVHDGMDAKAGKNSHDIVCSFFEPIYPWFFGSEFVSAFPLEEKSGITRIRKVDAKRK